MHTSDLEKTLGEKLDQAGGHFRLGRRRKTKRRGEKTGQVVSAQ